MSPHEERIAKLIEPTAEAEGFELVRVRVTGAKKKTLQVMAERPDKTMTAEDCAILSHALSPVLEENDPIEGTYDLEVSSPGIDRPLTRLKDFHDWQGYAAKLELDRMVEGRKRFQGVLGGIEDDNVRLDIAGEDETALIPFAWVSSAKLTLTDELIRDTLKAAKALQANDNNEPIDPEDQDDPENSPQNSPENKEERP
ncbi:MAG: ribosome maturation factor RimP [Pseudomonadota bacterium]